MTEHAPVAASGAASASPSVPVPVSVSVSVNGEHRSVPAGTALDALVASLTSAHSGVAAALNEAVVPRSQWSATALAEGDRVEVLTAVQGG
ncbi:sulfur carrier protein ThiS [Streptomyces salyersiae]|uniref:Sulfur carrier protein ThiS n=1 Tax=Streptomyces salyersiae TaxID=3075530 RepID=A0ABU2RMV7_9ACTN|nr:sulfur carrier protein ThiS [Streptomyces sp. DSM 41770]MDT0430190.1 sulfur carrier protein ThiS [Streptomyces sp. DSM 41770]